MVLRCSFKSCSNGEKLTLTGIRIPSIFVKEYNLKKGSKVEIFNDGEKISIKPKNDFILAELMKNVAPENMHTSIDTGLPLGNKAW